MKERLAEKRFWTVETDKEVEVEEEVIMKVEETGGI